MPHIGYKTLFTADRKLCFARLEISDDALTNEGRAGVKVKEKAKFRCSKATVVDICDPDGTQITEAYSQYDEKFKYTVGQTVESEFDTNIDEVCGKGIHYFLSQVIYLWDFVKYGYTGVYIGYCDSGQIHREENYFDGKREGKFVVYSESGQINQEGNFVDGKLNGRYVQYYESGKPIREANFVNGNLHGRFVCYYESGQIESVINFINGMIQIKIEN